MTRECNIDKVSFTDKAFLMVTESLFACQIDERFFCTDRSPSPSIIALYINVSLSGHMPYLDKIFLYLFTVLYVALLQNSLTQYNVQCGDVNESGTTLYIAPQ
ncbi:hypothetical protein CEXT_791151 [Caerostris extrusa]|uniref:Uncharacterized protein n=1 Tax=Caerostris extrusa TaxID=172846 RepID=A0AAV4NQW7_CAEEX|nr:hypothetical protein CEXT_791151 [Caerostris extrusa]